MAEEALLQLNNKEKGGELSEKEVFLRDRINRIAEFNKKAQTIWESPIPQKFLQ